MFVFNEPSPSWTPVIEKDIGDIIAAAVEATRLRATR